MGKQIVPVSAKPEALDRQTKTKEYRQQNETDLWSQIA